jgi:hypothetical protein
MGAALTAAAIWSGAATAAPVDTAPAIAVALGSQPLPADQLALGARLAKGLDLDESVHTGLEALYGPLRARARQKVAEAPPDFKKRFVAASDQVANDMERRDFDAIMAGLARYFAASLPPADLARMAAFFEDPVVAANIGDGDKLKAHADELTEIMPASGQMEAFADISAAANEVGLALLDRRLAAFPSTLRTEMCRALISRKLATECPPP